MDDEVGEAATTAGEDPPALSLPVSAEDLAMFERAARKNGESIEAWTVRVLRRAIDHA